MSKNLNTIVVTLLFLVVISGCSAVSRTDLVKRGVLNIERQRTGKIYIVWSDEDGDGDGFVVTGVLRRRDHLGAPIKTHVDITILSPDGAVLDKARSSDVYVSRRISGRGYPFDRFKVRFPSIPAQGSLVRVVSHIGQFENTVFLKRQVA